MKAPPCPDGIHRQLAEWFAPGVDRLVELGFVERGQWKDFV